ASIKKDTDGKNSFGRVRRGSAGLNKLAKQLEGGAAVCSGPRSGLRSLGRLVQSGADLLAQNRAQLLLDFFLQAEWIEPGHELFQTCDLDWVGLRAGFQTRQRCGRLVVDAPFAAAFTFGTQVLHDRAEQIAK